MHPPFAGIQDEFNHNSLFFEFSEGAFGLYWTCSSIWDLLLDIVSFDKNIFLGIFGKCYVSWIFDNWGYNLAGGQT